jgi:hypothetical protein
MKAEILKNMMIDGRKVPSGTIVDVKGWKHAKSLANNRYIRFIEDAPQPKVEAVEEPKKVKKSVPKAQDAE